MFSWLVSPYKDVNSLPEIKLLDNEEIIFLNYKINALDEGHTTWNQKLAFYYCTLTNKAFYFLILRKLHPEVKFFARTTTTIKTQNFDEKVYLFYHFFKNFQNFFPKFTYDFFSNNFCFCLIFTKLKKALKSALF